MLATNMLKTLQVKFPWDFQFEVYSHKQVELLFISAGKSKQIKANQNAKLLKNRDQSA